MPSGIFGQILLVKKIIIAKFNWTNILEKLKNQVLTHYLIINALSKYMCVCYLEGVYI